jgi:hypothetical protein
MRDKEIKCCPFRVGMETHKSATIEGEIYRKEYFCSCMKEDCPAFYIAYGGYGQEYERCKRLQR